MSAAGRWLRSWCCVTSLACAVTLAQAGQASDSNPFDGMARAYLVEVDGQVLWQKAPQQRLSPASLTKLMTALLVAEQLNLDASLSVSAAAAAETGSKLGLRRGQVWRVQDMLAASLLASANDACHALAEGLAGSQARFVQRMNQRAQAMGLRNTRFANACGHDAPDHYSSAEDLRSLAHAVMQNQVLAALVALADKTIRSVDGTQHYMLTNTNALIDRYPGAVGIKTGTTPQAGKCLVALARRGTHKVLLVLLKGKDRWWDATDALDIAFASAETAH